MRLVIMCVLVSVLASCGGGNRTVVKSGGAVMRLSTGPISKACMASDRKARNSTLCGCIQTVANQTLDGGDQRMAARFFSDPHQAQEIRQSDRLNHEVFWKKYKAFAGTAERSCR